MKQLAQKNASDAFYTERARTREFDQLANLTPTASDSLNLKADGVVAELPQPDMFQGNLKGYQIKGMTWLANLYDQGISGILADGKFINDLDHFSCSNPFVSIFRNGPGQNRTIHRLPLLHRRALRCMGTVFNHFTGINASQLATRDATIRT